MTITRLRLLELTRMDKCPWGTCPICQDIEAMAIRCIREGLEVAAEAVLPGSPAHARVRAIRIEGEPDGA